MKKETTATTKAKEEIAPIQEKEVAEQYKVAVELHCQVMISKEQVETALCTFAMNLKKMRDGKQYITLGYDSFADYVERGVNIEIRQVYTYISAYENLGSDVLQSNARLGITKLALLATVPDIERADFIEDNDLAGMSVKEIKALIEQSKQQIEQISMLNVTIENQKVDLEQVKLVEKTKEELQQELEALKSKPIDVAVAEVSEADIDKIKADVEKTIKADYEAKRKQEIKDVSDKAIEKAKKDFNKQLEAAKAQAASDAAEQFKQSLADTESEKVQALEKAEKLAKELKVAADGDMTTIQFYLNEFSELFSKITAKIADIKKTDKDKAAGLSGAVTKILMVLLEQNKGE